MGKINVKTAAVLNARPEDLYATIADYRNTHPRILPPQIFDLQVEKGGYGEGTIHRFKTRVLGVEQSFYQITRELEPGRVIVEKDIEDTPQQLATSFTITPVENGQKARVEIATVMNASPGLQGLIERLIFATYHPRMYRVELQNLERVAQERSQRASETAQH
ncbi:hypothetical protein EPA93_29390 [Ktedonosporobacter rubrisoli]|uniref:SRPBCC family protein n=1 Tax=Ktedonosporobacter rubrisoli TaxID=2509675 RepID=A0A4P6JWU6_KTERU|nr:SRPBCC family protein [Ktedonosporobacter rubrisoli]QBD79872.1 hypothetical protein EPA93_29390 [Ktedonosporobacter rubrisoli]